MLPTSWLILGALLAAVLAGGGGYFYGVDVGHDQAEAQKARDERLVREARDAMAEVAAKAIGGIRVRNTTIRQEAQSVIREVPVYRDCKHDPAVRMRIDAALDGTDPVPAGGSGLRADSFPPP